MEPKSDIDEVLLVAAFNRREKIEIAKTKALITAQINPEKANDAFMEYVELAIPEYKQARIEKDNDMMDVLKKESDVVYKLSGTSSGADVVRMSIKDSINADI